MHLLKLQISLGPNGRMESISSVSHKIVSRAHLVNWSKTFLVGLLYISTQRSQNMNALLVPSLTRKILVLSDYKYIPPYFCCDTRRAEIIVKLRDLHCWCSGNEKRCLTEK
jgi:hypothetical protein